MNNERPTEDSHSKNIVDDHTISSPSLRGKRVEWMWKSNLDPFNASETEEWTLYSDVEIEIIEEAFQQEKCSVLIDDYNIDLKRLSQMSTKNKNDELPIKRRLLDAQQKENNGQRRTRSNRFEPLDTSILKHPFIGEDSTEDFIAAVTAHFNLQNEKYNDPCIRQKMVEEAAGGLIVKGKEIGKQIEAEWMAQQLEKVVKSSGEEVWQCCARLYTKDSFLYRKMNEIMRLVGDGDKNHQAIWKSEVDKLGPFIWLLYWLRGKAGIGSTITVYRGATLSEDLTKQFQQANRKDLYEFPAFTSTTVNRQIADIYGNNVLFIIDISPEDGNDLGPYSYFPDEEEILIVSSFLFKITSCEKVENKWNIHLTSILASSYSTSSSDSSIDSSAIDFFED